MRQNLLLSAAALLLAVLALGLVVQTNLLDAFDRAIALPLSLTEQSSAPLVRLMIWVSWVGGGGIQRYVIVALIGVLLWRLHSARAGVTLVLLSVLANLTSEGLKLAYGRHRPDLVPHLDPIGSAAYPSGHATSAAVVYLLLAALAPPHWRTFGFAAAILAMLLNGMSRIMLGVHWPTDIIGGTMLGAAFALVGLAIIARGNPSATPVVSRP